MSVIFDVQQDSLFIDGKIFIKVLNLPAFERVFIQAEMCDNLGTCWQSFGEFISNAEGKVDLSVDEPRSGTYDVVDSMGLFWSMVPKFDNSTNLKTPLKPLETKLTLLINNDIIASATILRNVISPNLNRISIREEGIIGTFFYHESQMSLPTIIVLGGSGGGLREGQAALLASYGFNTLALAYFGIEDLPNELVEIPLEYIEKAIDWLKENPKVDITKLGMLGTSKGGELALLSASKFSLIKAVAAYVPSGVIYPGISKSLSGKSSWKYKGESLPFAYENVPSEVELEIISARENGDPVSWRKVYQYWAEGAVAAEISVENIKGSILLISGGDDQLWPADLLCQNIMNRLEKYNHPFIYKHLNLKKAGHAIGLPGFPTSTSLIAAGNLLLGGTPQENAAAQFEAWEEVKKFFKTELI